VLSCALGDGILSAAALALEMQWEKMGESLMPCKALQMQDLSEGGE
jgi:hypothetical protein